MTSISDDLLQFISASPTPYHAVESTLSRLGQAGFAELPESGSFAALLPGGHFVRRGDSSILAFVLPAGDGAISGFRIIGAHTDSPNLRLKPRAEYVKEGYRQLGVEVYGGALLNSWLDRDLGVAGRIVFRDGEGGLRRVLCRIDRPLLRIPQLAIHLDREVNDRGLSLNKQEHLAPVLGLLRDRDQKNGLLALCARELSIPTEAIVSSELMLHDVVPPTRAGLDGEFLFAPRLDNQAMCHAALCSLLGAAGKSGPEGVVPLIVLFDHEEVGSNSAYGAASSFLPSVLERIVLSRSGGREEYHRAIARSLCVSADMAHAVHPNYADRHEARHRPVLNGGPVVKVNAQQRYATCARTAALFEDLCRQEDVPVQHYAHRTDLPCGSTIGPITATLLGMRTVDVGNPMLSMHSAREMAGARDPELMVRVLTRFLHAPDPF